MIMIHMDTLEFSVDIEKPDLGGLKKSKITTLFNIAERKQPK